MAISDQPTQTSGAGGFQRQFEALGTVVGTDSAVATTDPLRSVVTQQLALKMTSGVAVPMVGLASTTGLTGEKRKMEGRRDSYSAGDRRGSSTESECSVASTHSATQVETAGQRRSRKRNRRNKKGPSGGADLSFEQAVQNLTLDLERERLMNSQAIPPSAQAPNFPAVAAAASSSPVVQQENMPPPSKPPDKMDWAEDAEEDQFY